LGKASTGAGALAPIARLRLRRRLKQSAASRRRAAGAEQNQATEIIDPDTGEITPA
jgi:hypothetical protein